MRRNEWLPNGTTGNRYGAHTHTRRKHKARLVQPNPTVSGTETRNRSEKKRKRRDERKKWTFSRCFVYFRSYRSVVVCGASEYRLQNTNKTKGQKKEWFILWSVVRSLCFSRIFSFSLPFLWSCKCCVCSTVYRVRRICLRSIPMWP